MPRKNNLKELKSTQVIVICIGTNWGTRERTALKDIKFYIDQGADLLVYCSRDSFLDLEVKRLKVNIQYHTGGLTGINYYLQNYFQIRKIVKGAQKSHIHLYGTKFATFFSFALRDNYDSTFFISVFRDKFSIPFGKFGKFLLKRVDKFFFITKEHLKCCQFLLPRSSQKFVKAGLGVNPVIDYNNKSSTILLIPKPDEILIGTLFEASSESVESIIPILNSLNSLQHKIEKKLGKKLRLIIFAQRNWEEFYIYGKLLKLIQKLGLSDIVTPVSIKEPEVAFKSLKLWIHLPHFESLNDFVIKAILSKVQVLVPRTTTFHSFIQSYPFSGFSFKPTDAREIAESAFHLISEHKEASEENIKELLSSFDNHFYENKLLSEIRNSTEKRRRFIQRRKAKHR